MLSRRHLNAFIFLIIIVFVLLVIIALNLLLFLLLTTFLTEYLHALGEGFFEVLIASLIYGLNTFTVSFVSKDLLQFLKCEHLWNGLDNVPSTILASEALTLVLDLSDKFLMLFMSLASPLILISFDFNDS